MFVFQLPDGCLLKAYVLDWKTVDMLKDQCEPREISSLVTTAGPREEYFLSENSSWNALLTNPPFVSGANKIPAPGMYRVLLKGDREADWWHMCLSGTAVTWLYQNQSVAQELAAKDCGNRLQYYTITSTTADAKYSIAIICNVIVVALDFAQHTDRMLLVEPPASLLNGDTAESSGGAICGTILAMAQILPYSILFDMVVRNLVSEVLFTGEGLSGSVAHAAAILFRELFRAAAYPPQVKAISFSGPLCGSPYLHEHLTSTAQKGNHITVNCGGAILDRLLADFQRMSPLATREMSSWKFVYDAINGSLRTCMAFHDGSARVDISVLAQAEDNLRQHVTILSSENTLMPIGRYVFCNGSKENSVEDEGNLMELLNEMEATEYPAWRSYFSLREVDIRTLPAPTFWVARGDYTPRITAVTLIQTLRRLTVNIEGKYLDTVHMRLLDSEVIIPSVSDIQRLPLSLSADSLSIGPSARVLSVRCFPEKTIIDFAGLTLSGPGAISLETDFGVTNTLDFNYDCIVQGQDLTPVKSLHPTMNAEFLSGAFLRVAICCRQCGGRENLLTHNRSMAELLDLLLSLEGELCDFADSKLINVLSQFMDDQVDLSMLRHISLSRFEEISRIATAPVKVEEMLVYNGVRQGTGCAKHAVGNLLTFAGVLLSIPAVILALPAVNLVHRVLQSDGSTMRTWSNAYMMETIGPTVLPGIVLSTLGPFNISAARHAAANYPSHRYKQVLGTIITTLGGNPLEVVDELPQVEEYVMSRMCALYPQVILSRCTMEELVGAIDQSMRKDIEDISVIGKRLKCNRPILAKLLIVGRMHGIRQRLQSNLMIGFVGVHNAGKSTSIERLFEVDAQSDILKRTEQVNAICIGKWIDRVAGEHAGFKQWLYDKRRNELQLYAVDFPGITDEREEIGSLTSYSAELATMYVVIVKAGHIAAPEKKAVRIAKVHHKPFIVVINHADTIAHELKIPGNEERIRRDYANTLGVPPELIHFMNALDHHSIDKLRGILFGILQTLIGNPDVGYALALRMIPPTVVADIDEELFRVPDMLSAAAYSLMFNLCPMRSSTLTAACAALLRDSSRVKFREIGTYAADLRYISLGGRDVVRRVGLSLAITHSFYETVTKLIFLRSIPFKAAMDHTGRTCMDKFTGKMKKHLENIVGTLTLSAIREQIHHYFGKPVPGATGNFAALAREVLLGLQLICSKWMDIGFEQEVVELTCMELFGGAAPVNTSVFLQRLSTVGEPQLTESNPSQEESDLDYYDATELTRYSSAHNEMMQLRNISFTPCPDETCNKRPSEGDQELAHFRNGVNIYIYETLTAAVTVELFSLDGTLSAMLEFFSNLTVEQLSSTDIVFTVVGVEGGADSTHKLLKRAACELNDHPEQVYMVKDPSSGLIHPDPYMCIGLRTGSNTCPNVGDPSIAEVLCTYGALGRLLGYVAVKHVVGVSFPVNFSLSVYKVLLGRPIGMRDLAAINPELGVRMEALCIMDDCSLTECDLRFNTRLEYAASSKISKCKVYEFCRNGNNIDVQSCNRIQYVRDYMKVQLCCTDDKMIENIWRELLVGMLEVCPRECFNCLSPEGLQVVVQGCPVIDLQEWIQCTDVQNVTESASEVISWFWSVMGDVTALDRARILYRATGSAVLSAQGLRDLLPKFSVHVCNHLAADDVPRWSLDAHTLILPRYPSKNKLRQFLLMDICDVGVAV